MLNSKSFREIKNVAPYGKPKTKITNDKNNGKRKVSIFNKFKTLINKSFDSLKSDDEDSSSHRDAKLNAPMVPGGFFEEGNRSIHNKTNDSIIASSQIGQQINHDETEGDESMANVSNAKLASFFAQKGDAPLTDIEMEGVMSLMRKSSMPQLLSQNNHDIANSTFTSLQPTDENAFMHNFDSPSHNNKVFKSSRILSTSSNANTTNNHTIINGFKIPQFVPKYDRTTDSTGSRVSSINSTTSTRRVFDYSGMKSPYRKTVIFKYPSHRRSVSTPHPHVSKSISSKTSQNKKSNNGQRMTNVASALVTLLENNNNNNTATNGSNNNNSNGEDKSITITKQSKSLANPYSSIIRKPQQRQQFVNLEKKNEPRLVTKQPVAPATPIVSSANTTITNTYKPARSSSLRSNVVIADDEENKKKEKEVEEKKQEAEPIVPKSASFGFTFGSKDKTNEEKKSLEEVKPAPFPVANKKPATASAPPLFSIPIPKRKNDNEKNIETVETKQDDDVVMTGSTDTTSKYKYEFETPTKSGIDASQLDDSKVEQFKSMFVF